MTKEKKGFNCTIVRMGLMYRMCLPTYVFLSVYLVYLRRKMYTAGSVRGHSSGQASGRQSSMARKPRTSSATAKPAALPWLLSGRKGRKIIYTSCL